MINVFTRLLAALDYKPSLIMSRTKWWKNLCKPRPTIE